MLMKETRERHEMIRDEIVAGLMKEGMTIKDFAKMLGKSQTAVGFCIRSVTSTKSIRKEIIDILGFNLGKNTLQFLQESKQLDQPMTVHLYRVDEAAKLFNVKISTVRSWIHQKKIPITKLGRAVRIRSDIVEMNINSGLEVTDSEKKV